MKKLSIVLLGIILLTGCANTATTKTASINQRVEENANLIVEEIHIETDEITNQEQVVQPEITDDEFTNYIAEINQDVETLTQKDELSPLDKKTLENTFITLTDFIFYGGEIKGKTFAELANDAKQNVIDIYEKIDAKIEEKIPGYKEKIKETTSKTYSDVKTKVTELKDELVNKYKEEIGEEKYNDQVETFNESKETMEESFQPVIDTIVDESKELYETTKDKLDNWYQTWKEERQ